MASQTAPVFQKSEVEVDKPCLIAPAAATDESPLHLSNYDQQVLFNLESVYFYPPSHKSSDDVIEVLREALSKLLVPYHFMAGRLRMSPGENRVEVDCNRAGALFAGASTHLTFADLLDPRTFTGLLKDFILHDPSLRVSEAPLLTVQVTRFRCGGFVVGVSRNHALVGGTSGDEFLANFTSIARGAGLQVPPLASRDLLRARSPPRPEFEHFEYQKVVDVPRDSYFTTPGSLKDLELQGNFGDHFRLWKTFNFSPELLNSLKSRALADGSLARCTTFEALATHVWQARTEAVNMDPEKLSNLLFVVDSRKVISPPLPAGFTGNSLSLASARMKSQELARESFSACVKQVQEAKARITSEYVRSSIDWLECNHGIPCIDGGMYLSSWAKFNFLGVDFGWGPPSHTMFIPGERSNNCAVFLPSQHGKGLDVCMALESHQASAFLKHTGSTLTWPPPPPPSPAKAHSTPPSRMSHSRCYSTSSASSGTDRIVTAFKKNWSFLEKQLQHQNIVQRFLSEKKCGPPA